MNKWTKKIVALAFIFTQFLIIPNVSASSLEEIQNQKMTIQKEVNQIQKQVNQELEEVSAITIELEELDNEIAEHEKTIVQTEEEIAEQEVLVAQRLEYTGNQLKSLQKSEVNNNILIGILQAESFSEVMNMIYSVSVLTSASEDRVEEAQKEHDKLTDMREALVVEKESLNEKQVAAVEKKEALNTKVADLRKVLAENESELNNLNAEERAIKAEQEAKRRAAAARNNVTTASSNQSAASKSTSNTTQKSASTSAGEWRTVQATGYSTQQRGLSTHTALGIDLRVNPRVIAVDPRVIPLGSLVEVQGLGVYVAGDTGGAIKGNIIDIHYPTVRQALNWGRRNVKIRVIN
ncbi:MAG TPA: 3D domain-containing protein [Atopostipes sp.]|nr:3D domain-containing protein [Atopostipes sp.]